MTFYGWIRNRKIWPDPRKRFGCDRIRIRNTASHCGVKGSKFLKKLGGGHWASHRSRVKLRGVHPTKESSSPLCITPRSQTAHWGVKIKIFESLWLLFVGQSGEILLEVNTSIMIEKIWRKFLFAKPKILTPRCVWHRGVEFFELCDRISRWNRNQIRKYFSLFIRGTDEFESWKKWRLKISWHTPFKQFSTTCRVPNFFSQKSFNPTVQ